MKSVRFGILAALLMSVSAPAQAQLLGTDVTTDSQRSSGPVESRTDTIVDPGAEIQFGDGDAFSWMVAGDSIDFHPRTSLTAPWAVTIRLGSNHNFGAGELLTLVFTLDPTLVIPHAVITRAVTVDRVAGSIDGNVLTVELRNMVEVSQDDFGGEVQIAFSLAAENDADGDTVVDDVDNCPFVHNPDQADADQNGVGDACQDSDQDGMLDIDDNCPFESNADQLDMDEDGFGDACDLDIDGDDVSNEEDNCPFVPNPGQADFDGDGVGDACEVDTDGDGVGDLDDRCPFTPLGDVADSDGCSVSQLCPCDNEWKNHGAYMRCVAQTSERFVDDGLLTGAEKDAVVSQAANSQCGKK